MKTSLLILATFCVFFAASPVNADPLYFSNVSALQGAGSRIDLFTNQGAVLWGPQVSFLVDVTGVLPQGVTNILQVTYTEFGNVPLTQTLSIPAFGTVPPPFTALFTFVSPGADFDGVFATLTVDIIGSAPDFIIPSGGPVNSYTYSFSVARPIPEPAAIFLLMSGLAALGMPLSSRNNGRRRRRKNSS